MLGNGPHMFDNGPQVLGKSTFGLMLHSGLLYSMWHSEFCHIHNFATFGILSLWVLCRIRYYVAFGVMSFGIMLHSGLCRSESVVFGLMSFGVMSFGLLLVYPPLSIILAPTLAPAHLLPYMDT